MTKIFSSTEPTPAVSGTEIYCSTLKVHIPTIENTKYLISTYFSSENGTIYSVGAEIVSLDWLTLSLKVLSRLESWRFSLLANSWQLQNQCFPGRRDQPWQKAVLGWRFHRPMIRASSFSPEISIVWLRTNGLHLPDQSRHSTCLRLITFQSYLVRNSGFVTRFIIIIRPPKQTKHT